MSIKNNTCATIKLFFLFIVLFGYILGFAQTQDFQIVYSVSVVGAVQNPGVYKVPPISRISDVLFLSNPKITIPLDSLNILPNTDYSTRNIILSRKNKTIQIDLARFFLDGNDKNNPYLMDGDVIIVPAKKKTITIYGAVSKPGEYELKDGDRLSDILDFSYGVTEDVYTESAEIARFANAENQREILQVNLANVLSDRNSQDNLVLNNDDTIYIRSKPEFHISKEVEIRGEIKFPGKYPIRENQTTLLEILTKAGGMTQFSDLNNAILQRLSKEDIPDSEFERLKRIPVQNMNTLEYEYFKTKSRELRGKFAVNFNVLWNDHNSAYNVVLKDRDFIYIPNKNVTVDVSGQVRNPGLIVYKPGENFLYYIEQARGLSWNAHKSKIRIIKANTGEWLKPDDSIIIEVGDQIFVQEKPELKIWTITKEAITALAQLATLIVVIKSVTGN